MKRFTIAITLCVFTALICLSQNSEDLLNKTIKLKNEKGTIQSFIDEISNSSNVVFSYEPPEIPLQKEVRLSKKEMKLEEILNELFKNTSIDFIIHSRVIILKKNPSKKGIDGKKGKGVISGIIKDSVSGESLVGAIVYIDNLKLGEIANSYGYYSITVPTGKYKIQISSVGYNLQTIDTFLTGAIRLDFVLAPSIRELEEVIISKKQSRINDFQQSISRIDMQDVKELPSLFGIPDMLRNIQLLPGVNTTSEIGGNFQVRGGSWDQNLMMIDEAIVYNPNHMFGMCSTFNPDIIKDVKFYKGGIPADYGGRVSSVINVTQKEGNLKNFHIDGTIGLVSSGLSIEGPLVTDKCSFIVGARRSLIEPYMQFINNQNAKEIRPYFYDINSKINYIPDQNNRIYLSGYMGQDFISQNISSSYNNDVNYGNITGTLRFNHIFNERLFSNTSVIYSKYKMWVDQHPDSLSYKDQMGLEHYEFKSEFTYSPFKHKLNFGVQSIYYTFHPGDQIPDVNDSAYINKIDLEAEHAIESAVFIEDQYSLTPSLEIQFGLRFSDYNYLGAADIYKYLPNEPRDIRNITDTIHYGNNKIIQNYNNIEPRLALKYKINENQVATLTYNKMAQYVQLVSRTFDPLPYNMWKPGDNYLKPLTGNQFSAGWFVQFPDRNIDFSIESYYKLLDNVLEVKPGADIFLNKALDASLLQGIGRAYGIELALNKTEGKLTGMVSYTWSRTEIKVDSKFMEDKINFGKYYPADYDVPNKFTSAGVYRIGKRLSFTANFFYQTGRPLTLPSGEFIYYNQLMPYYSGKNLDRYPSYNRLDLGAILYNRQKPGRKWQGCWMLSVYNVYSRENDYAVIIQEKANSRDTQAVKEWIFNVVPSLSYSFKF